MYSKEYAKILSGPSITIPLGIRKFLNLRSGDLVKIEIVGNTVKLTGIRKFNQNNYYDYAFERTITEKGQIKLPKKILDILKIDKGFTVEFDEFSDGIDELDRHVELYKADEECFVCKGKGKLKSCSCIMCNGEGRIMLHDHIVADFFNRIMLHAARYKLYAEIKTFDKGVDNIAENYVKPRVVIGRFEDSIYTEEIIKDIQEFYQLRIIAQLKQVDQFEDINEKDKSIN